MPAGSNMSGPKKQYTPPEIRKYRSITELPAGLEQGIADLLPTGCVVEFDENRVYVQVSPAFANALGYAPEELTGRRIDDITAKNTVDIEFVFDSFLKLGEMDGIWIFRDRSGRDRIFHYHAMRSENRMCAELQPLALAS